MKEWVFSEIDKQIASNLAEECGIDSFTAYLLCAKGICDPFLVDEFLSDDIVLQDPYCFADMDKGVMRIQSAIENGEKIAVFGDYDCDGVTSTTLLYSVLTQLGANCMWRVPTRDEGYGMRNAAIDELYETGVKLIITVDNGISAFDEIDYANGKNIDVVVTDHHLPGEKLPNAIAVINPKRIDCPTDFKDFAGVGVAFMLCCALADVAPEDLLKEYGDLVCIGTIADVMPLVSDNRAIVKEGIKCIKNQTRVGVSALIKAAGSSLEKITSTNIAFTIAPRINACGRVFRPEKAIELLLCDDEKNAESLAEELCELNTKRRDLESEILQEALEMISNDEKISTAPVIVVQKEDWHHGVIGIVAAKLCAMFSRPAVVFSLDDDYAVGSARGYEGASIYDILSGVSEYAVGFGGHNSAAGITIKREDFEKVKTEIQYSAKKLYNQLPFDKLEIACKLNPNSLSVNSVYAQMNLEPFGEGNEKPTFAILNMYIVNIVSLSGGKHLKLVLSRSGGFDNCIEVMSFFTNLEEFSFKKGDKIDIAVAIDVNVFNGNENLSIVLKDIRSANIEQEELIRYIREYQNFKYFGDIQRNLVVTREDVAQVYKRVRTLKYIQADDAALGFIFKTNDYFKLRIILDILVELNFIDFSFDGKYKIYLNETAEHRDLIESKMFAYFS